MPYLLIFFSGVVLGLSVSMLGGFKDFKFFNTWFMFLVFTMLVLTPICTIFFVYGTTEMLKNLPLRTLKATLLPSLFGGLGIFLLSNSIRKGESANSILLFLLAVLVGIALRAIIFQSEVFSLYALGLPILCVFIWLIVNKEFEFYKSILPLLGGLAGSGFAVVFDIEPQFFISLGQSFDNQAWQVNLFKISLMSLGANLILLPIFLAQMSQKNAWVFFDTPYFWKNAMLIFGISILVVLGILGFSYAIPMLQDTLERQFLSLFFTGIIFGNTLNIIYNSKGGYTPLFLRLIVMISLNLELIFEFV